MRAVTKDIVEWLEVSDTGLVFATNLHISRTPATPVNCVTIYDTSGGEAEGTYEGVQYYRPSIQILVRNNSYEAGYDLACEIRDILHTISNEVKEGSKYIRIKMRGDIMQVPFPTTNAEGMDKNKIIFSLHFDIERVDTIDVPVPDPVNAYYILKDTAGVTISTGSIVKGTTKSITAPDGIAAIYVNDFFEKNESIRSNQTEQVDVDIVWQEKDF